MPCESLEAKRREYQPPVVRVLFIGESAPANGTFFYYGNSNLAKYTREAFEAVFGKFNDMSQFLDTFRERGCYLVDLCSEPVNQLSNKSPQRRAVRESGVSPLSAFMRELQPKPRVMVVVMKAIEKYVRRAAKDAELADSPLFVLPFPVRGHQGEYVRRLSELLKNQSLITMWRMS